VEKATRRPNCGHAAVQAARWAALEMVFGRPNASTAGERPDAVAGDQRRGIGIELQGAAERASGDGGAGQGRKRRADDRDEQAAQVGRGFPGFAGRTPIIDQYERGRPSACSAT
jgi:hypothetical protein